MINFISLIIVFLIRIGKSYPVNGERPFERYLAFSNILMISILHRDMKIYIQDFTATESSAKVGIMACKTLLTGSEHFSTLITVSRRKFEL